MAFGKGFGETEKSWSHPPARRANTEEENFVVFHNKPFRGCFIFPEGTTREFKGPVAPAAVKVVVMPLPGSFIQSPERRMGHTFQPPVVDENLDVPIDRCLVERLHELAAIFENLVHSQRPLMLPEGLLYGHSLGRFAPQGLPPLSRA